MSNWGRRPITDAGKAKTNPPHLTYYFQDEERLDRRPLGRVERFVDPQGNVVSLQLGAEGDPQRQVTMDRRRMEYRRDGFIEHAKCPLRHGTFLMAGAIGKDFSSMAQDQKFGKVTVKALPAEPCNHDPKTLERHGHDLYAKDACPHIEWLIEFRRERARFQNEKRNARRIAEERREEKRRMLEDLQLKKAESELGISDDDTSSAPEPRRRRRGVEEPTE